MKTSHIFCSHCHRDAVIDDIPISECPYCSSSDIALETMTIPDPPFLACMGFTKLNTQQQEIVKSTEGLNYVEAGPGTAKSTTLVARARYIIHGRRDNQHTPLVLTFTNQAVERITNAFLNESPKNRPEVYTLHGFAYRVLLKYRIYLPIPLQHFRLMNGNDIDAIIHSIRHEEPALCGDLNEEELKKIIRQRKCAGVSICASETDTLLSCFARHQMDYGVLDFDDLLPLAVELLHREEIRQCFDDVYRYVLVDESQDLTDTELALLELLTRHYRNLFLVGDTDQSIYGWRGAKNRVLDWLNSLGLMVHTFALTLNYRSSLAILNTAKSVIQEAANRKNKELIAVYPKGPLVLVKECRSTLDEARMIANAIELAADPKIQNKPLKYSEIAVLTRNRRQLNLIRTTLMKKKIPVSMEEHTALFDHPQVISVLDFLSFLARPDTFRFTRIADFLIPDEVWPEFRMMFVACKENAMEALNCWYAAGNMMSERGADCLKMLNNLQQHLPKQRSDGVSYCLNGILDFLHADGKAIAAFRKICCRLIRKYGCDLNLFLDQLVMCREQEQDFVTTQNHVALMTLHAAKGREFKKVFLAGVNDSGLPASKGDIEEERRLLYVGITRAQRELVLSYVQSSHIRKEHCSPFLEPLKQCDSVLFCRITEPAQKK